MTTLPITDWRRLGEIFRAYLLIDDDGTILARGISRQGRPACCYVTAARHDWSALMTAVMGG